MLDNEPAEENNEEEKKEAAYWKWADLNYRESSEEVDLSDQEYDYTLEQEFAQEEEEQPDEPDMKIY